MTTQQLTITISASDLEAFISGNEGTVRQKIVQQIDDKLIKGCIGIYGNNQTKVADVLGVNRGTLRKRMKILGYIV